MPVNLGVDTKAAAVTKRNASGFRKLVEDFLEAAFKSDRNAFGSAAILTAAEQSGLATGQLLDFAGTTAPPGFLECNGAEVSRSTYADLWTAIGSTYGTAQAATDFKLPDFRGASATGAGGTRVAGPATAIGSTHDSDTATLAAGNLPQHAHSIDEQSDSGGGHSHTWNRYPPFGFQTESNRDGSGSSEDGARGNTAQNDLANHIRQIEIYVERGHLLETYRWVEHSNEYLENVRRGGSLGTVAPYALGTPGISYSRPSESAKTGLAGGHTHTVTGTIDDAGGGEGMSVLQPSLAVMVLIKT